VRLCVVVLKLASLTLMSIGTDWPITVLFVVSVYLLLVGVENTGWVFGQIHWAQAEPRHASTLPLQPREWPIRFRFLACFQLFACKGRHHHRAA